MSFPARVASGGRKSALLIGICGSQNPTVDYPKLKGSHKDVLQIHDLLVDCYGYTSANINILIDDGIPGHIQPTRNNILQAIAALVKDAKTGDDFCFHYCGHSTQVKNRTNSEEDGMDECMIPSDGVDKKIVDNELNAALVLPLPAGCQLVAILDTCHSGSLLDLKHDKCNRVVVPWNERGKRLSEDIRHNVVRKDALFFSPSGGVTVVAGREVGPHSRTPSTHLFARREELNLKLVCPPAPKEGDHSSRKSTNRRTFTYRSRTMSLANEELVGLDVPTDKGDVLPTLSDKLWVLSEDGQRCDSPVAMFECTGLCRDADHDRPSDVKADVISLASCRDSELTYEDGDGNSMTSFLVRILRHNPNQSLKDVLTHISYAMYHLALARHENARKFRKQRKNYVTMLLKHLRKTMPPLGLPEPAPSPLAHSPSFPSPKKRGFSPALMKQVLSKMRKSAGHDMDNFQNPELASPRPLDMNRTWRM